jgi:hypothetical protein
MNEQIEHARPKRSISISIIAIINGLGLFITLLFWGTVYLEKLVPTPGSFTTVAERANAATTYGFMIGDIL